ncbi:MAG: alpha/beta fold hydrolase [Cytophagales bacterium]
MAKHKSTKFKLLIFALFISTLLFWTSCFRGYQMTDSDVTTYYQAKRYKPHFKTYKVDNRTIHYAEVGNDSLPLLLFIHGAPGAWYGYIQLLDDSMLQSKFHMISVDRAGYGKSGYGLVEKSIEKQAQYLQPIVDSNLHKAIYVVGRSFGAPVAAALAANNSNNIKSLLLLGADLDPDKERFWWFSFFGRLTVIRWLLPNSMNVATDEKYSRCAELKKMIPYWSKITMPTTLMHGADDWMVDTSNINFAKKMLTNAPLRTFILPATGHVVSSERPDLLKKEIFYYLAKK